MRKITVNLSFYNQNEILIKQVKSWQSLSEEILGNFSFCIIDDCSKEIATNVLKGIDMSSLDLSIYRVKEDLFCNIAGVRNLSASECKTEWMLILDMDTFINRKFAESIIDLIDVPSGNCFKFNRKVTGNIFHIKNGKQHPAVCLIRKDDYWKVGGCEEDLVGNYGQTDPIFWYRAKGILNIQYMKNIFLEYDPKGESDILRDREHNLKLFEEKKLSQNWSSNYIRFNWEKIY